LRAHTLEAAPYHGCTGRITYRQQCFIEAVRP
jgi:hypothetical protein